MTNGGDASGITVNENGTVTVDTTAYELAPGATEVIEYSYNVLDGQGGSVAQTATITITGTNDAPTVGAAIVGAGDEDTGTFGVNLLAGANDVDGGTLSVDSLTVTNGGDASGITVNANGTVTVDTTAYELAPGATEVIEYSYNVLDGQGGSVAQTATITITGTNDAPTVGAAIVGAGDEDTGTFGVNLLAGANDVDGGTLSVDSLTVTNGGDASGITVNANGTVTVDTTAYELAPGATEVIEYSYNVLDGQGGSVAQTADDHDHGHE